MKGKKWIKWAALLVLFVIAAVYCFTWPGREIGTDADVTEGSRTLEAEDARKVVRLLRRPHIPTVSDRRLDCLPEIVFTVKDQNNEAAVSIHCHTNKGYLGVNGEKWYYFYIPHRELRELEELFPE